MEKFLENYMKDMSVKKVENGFDLKIPFTLYPETIDPITLHLQKNEQGMYDIDDKGFVCRHLNNLDVNLIDNKYQAIIWTACKFFRLKIENNIVKSTIGYGVVEHSAKTNEKKYIDLTYVNLHMYLQGLTLLYTMKWLV